MVVGDRPARVNFEWSWHMHDTVILWSWLSLVETPTMRGSIRPALRSATPTSSKHHVLVLQQRQRLRGRLPPVPSDRTAPDRCPRRGAAPASGGRARRSAGSGRRSRPGGRGARPPPALAPARGLPPAGRAGRRGAAAGGVRRVVAPAFGRRPPCALLGAAAAPSGLGLAVRATGPGLPRRRPPRAAAAGAAPRRAPGPPAGGGGAALGGAASSSGGGAAAARRRLARRAPAPGAPAGSRG